MTTYSVFYLPHDGYTPGPGVKRKSEKLGNSGTIEAAGDVIFADVARRNQHRRRRRRKGSGRVLPISNLSLERRGDDGRWGKS